MLKKQYPAGYEHSITRINNAKKEPIFVFPLEADEATYLDNLRLPLLENWEGQLLQCMWRKPHHPIFIALKDTIETFRLPVELFQDHSFVPAVGNSKILAEFCDSIMSRTRQSAHI